MFILDKRVGGGYQSLAVFLEMQSGSKAIMNMHSWVRRGEGKQSRLSRYFYIRIGEFLE